MSEKDGGPILVGKLEEAFSKASDDSRNGGCTEIFTDTVVYKSIVAALESGDGGCKITHSILRSLTEKEKSSLVDELREASAQTIKENAGPLSFLTPSTSVIGKDIEPHLFRI